MRALMLEKESQLKITNVESPTIGPNDVLIRVAACGICGSDVHGYDGSSGRRIPPLIMGHEAAGVIEQVGAKVSDYSVGDLVTFDSTVYCGECEFCQGGRVNLCNNRQVLGVSCGDYRRHGAFAEFLAVPARILYRIPQGVTAEEAAMVEPVSIAVHAASLLPIKGGETAVVVGTGMIGLLVVQAVRAAGCEKVIAIDVDQDRLNLARELGADVAILADDSELESKILAETKGQGAEFSLEVVGATAPIRTAIQSVRKGGHVALVGNISPDVDLPLQAVVTRELTLHGSCSSAGEYPRCMELMAEGKINVRPLISAQASLDEGAAWFKRLHEREKGLMKVILKP